MSYDPYAVAPRPFRSPAARAFSLMELLLVLVILAVLAGVVAPKFSMQSGKAKVTAARTQLTSFKSALGQFEINASRFPTTQEGLEALLERPSDLQEEEWAGPYLDTDAEVLDPWGESWQYRSPGTQNEGSYDLYSYGPDRKEGGDDDIRNWSTDR